MCNVLPPWSWDAKQSIGRKLLASSAWACLGSSWHSPRGNCFQPHKPSQCCTALCSSLQLQPFPTNPVDLSSCYRGHTSSVPSPAASSLLQFSWKSNTLVSPKSQWKHQHPAKGLPPRPHQQCTWRGHGKPLCTSTAASVKPPPGLTGKSI